MARGRHIIALSVAGVILGSGFGMASSPEAQARQLRHCDELPMALAAIADDLADGDLSQQQHDKQVEKLLKKYGRTCS